MENIIVFNKQSRFRLNLNDEDGAEVQAMMFCAENMSSDDIDLCVSKVLEKVYAQAPHLRPKDDDKDASIKQDHLHEKKLNFVLQRGQDPVKETESFAVEVLPKDVWCHGNF